MPAGQTAANAAISRRYSVRVASYTLRANNNLIYAACGESYSSIARFGQECVALANAEKRELSSCMALK